MKDMKARLKAWRDGKGISQETAARILSVTVSCYSKWETGMREPTGDRLWRINAILEGAK